MTDKIDLKSMTPVEIEEFCFRNLGQKPGQGTRVAVWLFRKKVEEIDQMEDLNRPLGQQLKQQCTISQIEIEQRERSEDGTEKLLYRLADGQTVEGF